jgi:hypothetical protein
VVTKKPRYFKSYANDLLMRLLIFGKDELLKEGQFWGFKEFLGKRVGNEVFCFFPLKGKRYNLTVSNS